MEFDWIWKAILIILGGTFLLRIAGRKSISQMTLAQTVVMIGIGSLLVQPVAGKSVWTTLGVGLVLVTTLVLMEYAQLKSDKVENLITGKSKILIENGILNEKNLKKLRITVDQLEMKLRQQNVTKINNIQWATLEANGQIGYILKEEALPATKKDFQLLQQEIHQLALLLNANLTNQPFQQQNQNADDSNLFTEVSSTSQKNQPPKYLQ